jgi:predicted AlkP superfamily phosphohydrolase/phosphomutase
MWNQTRKLLAVGLDGATFDLIRPWVEAGQLPTLSRLLRTGASGLLKSTIPALTPPAWVSSVTGVNPGKHGVFDFLQGKERHRPVSVTTRDWRVEPIWLRLGREGFKVGVVNFPVGYPPFPVNGFMLAGFLTPSTAEDYAYPPSLPREIKKAVGRYRTSVDEKNLDYDNPDAFLKDLARVTKLHTDTAVYLSRAYEVDFLQIIYDGLDRVQHYFWRFMDDSASCPEAHRQAILNHYRLLDTCIVRLLSGFPAETTVLVYSDHGFGPLRKRVHIETVLLGLGLMALNPEAEAVSSKEKLWGKEEIEAVAYKLGLGTRLKTLLPGSWKNALPSAGADRPERINWNQTRAFFASTPNQSIRINLAGREAQGIVSPGQEYEAIRQRLIDALMSLKDLDTNQPVIDKVYRREEIYQGGVVEQADDLIVCAAPGYYLVAEPAPTVMSQPDEARLAWSGIHRPEGIVIWSGPDTKSGQTLEPLSIQDIAPTMLHLMGLAVPEYMDGRVAANIFDPAFLRDHPVQIKAGPIISPHPVSGQSELTEEEQVAARLRSMGYIE